MTAPAREAPAPDLRARVGPDVYATLTAAEVRTAELWLAYERANECTPTQDEAAEMAGVSKTTIHEQVCALVRKGAMVKASGKRARRFSVADRTSRAAALAEVGRWIDGIAETRVAATVKKEQDYLGVNLPLELVRRVRGGGGK